MRTEKYFNCTDRDRAAFEAGIKLGGLFHQYMGSPVNEGSALYMEEAMKRATLAQPYVIDASVEIDRDVLGDCLSTYGYASLNERMLKARIMIGYKGWAVEASISWIDELGYPLMRIDSVRERLEHAGT
jgi:hypothetical protein